MVPWTAGRGDFDHAQLEEALQAWLARIGLSFHPFHPLDAGMDPRLSSYIVGHEAFASIWGDWPSLLFASAGGGKTAFRVRMARACRVGQNGKNVFPVVYKVPSPVQLGGLCPPKLAHLDALAQAAAYELLLALTYRPLWFLDDLDRSTQCAVRQVLEWNLPGDLGYFLEQLKAAGSLAPLVEIIDPTAELLPSPPDSSKLSELCAFLADLPVSTEKRPDSALRFDLLIELVLERLAFQAVYVLVDGIDAHPESIDDPERAVDLLWSLLEGTVDWATERIFVKYFLPLDLQPFLKEQIKVLTTMAKAVTIEIDWAAEKLIKVLRERLRTASERAFDSFDRLCTPALRDVEQAIVEAANPLPREVLMLAGRVLWEHVSRESQVLRLQPKDLDAAKRWYKELQTSSGVS